MFSFLSDKTNGASLFVKYKLLLGTLIIGLASTPGCKSKKQIVVCYDISEPVSAEIVCYDTTAVSVEEIEIKGTVTDKIGEPLTGALITTKNRAQGVSVDINGKFSLKANPKDTLVFSIIGFISKEVPVSEINNEPIIMEESDAVLSCYIVVTAESVGKKKINDIYLETKTLPELQIDNIVPAAQNNKEHEVKGTITDQSGKPIYGITIQVKNTTIGTLSDEKGDFKLKVKAKDILRFSYIGFLPLEIPASNFKDNMTIVMEEDNVVLCYEVVVIPYESDPIYSRSKRITKLPYLDVQIPPVSPLGNLETFQKWIENNIRYSEQMRKDKIEGELILGFSIDKKGKIVDKKVLVKLSPEADREALRILSLSDNWEPGFHDGKSIKTTITIPVKFKLNK